jgi:diguanylate cyclase (GGDEF)-like protein/PAS domain S-box-containing protein
MSPDAAKILIVDDDPAGRLVLGAGLSDAGFEVVLAADGPTALALFEERRPDLVVLDVVMEGMDGFEVCRRLREGPRGRQVPVLMLTGLDDLESVNRAYDLGATDFATKPVNVTLLGHRVRYMLRTQRTLRQLAESERALAQAQRLAHLGTWEWSFLDGSQSLSPEMLSILGLGRDRTPTRAAYLAALDPEDRHRLLRCHDELLVRGGRYSIEVRLNRADGARRVLRDQGEAVESDDGRVIRLKGTVQDLTELREAEANARYLSEHDSLTGLPNRATFDEWLAQTLVDAGERGQKAAILCIDLDDFRRVNETLGHGRGDALLAEVAGRLARSLREVPWASAGDLVLARAAGDEFLVALTGIADADDAARVAERVPVSLQRPFRVHEAEVFLTATIGIALFPSDGELAENLVSRAASALHHAKSLGRSGYRFYDSSMQQASARRLALEAGLRAAVERSELRLFLQPQVDAGSRRIVGAEALVRWHHPERGLLPPAEFVGFAEETGLIVSIGEWMLNAVCDQLAAWRARGLEPPVVALNVSPRELADPALSSRIRSAIEGRALPPASIELEITETALMADVDAATRTLRDLREIGVRICLDDFGTGYSSFGYLKRFVVDTLKIDRSFVRDLLSSAPDGAIVAAILAIAGSLRMGTVAEGVETEEQLRELGSLGCRVMQGFLFGRPMPAEEFASHLARPPAAVGIPVP